jgi:hypothetical protein
MTEKLTLDGRAAAQRGPSHENSERVRNGFFFTSASESERKKGEGGGAGGAGVWAVTLHHVGRQISTGVVTAHVELGIRGFVGRD